VSSAVARAAGPLGGALALHLLAALLLLRLSLALPPPALPKSVVQFDVVVKPPEPVKPAEPAPPPPKPLPAPVKIARTVRPPPKALPPPVQEPIPETKAPPPPTKEAPEPTNAPTIVTGITMESTSQGGTMSVAAGNTLRGTPAEKAPEPAQVKPYKAEQYASAAQVTELPAPLNREAVNLRKYYPPEALRQGFEGDVVLRLLIDSDGTIAKVDIVSDPGQGLGPAAAKAVREYRFRPAKVNGTPVATTVPFTIHFTIPD
jgi:protein TonB